MDAPQTFRYRVTGAEHLYRPIPREPPPISGPVHPPPEIRCDAISVVIPVKNNQAGIDRFLTSIAERCEPATYPGEIIIVDNDSDVMTEVRVDCPVKVTVLECKHRGPGPARNVGAARASGEWLLFTDSDCVATPSLVGAYARNDNAAVGYAGMVVTPVVDPFTQFYNDEKVFIPDALTTANGVVPKTLITANSLVLKQAFMAVGGFNAKFVYAAAEDSDLGFRLRMVGGLQFNLHSVVEHVVDDGLAGFMDRFVRYGRGHALLARHYTNPRLFEPFLPKHQKVTSLKDLLGEVCLHCMEWGYMLEAANGRG